MIKINKDERISFRVTKNEKEEIMLQAKKQNMSTSEFAYSCIKKEMEIASINDSQSQFFNMYEVAFKKAFETYFKRLMVVMNRIEFNSRWSLKQQDIFMQHLKVPQEMEDLIVSVVDHPITTKAHDLVLKDLRKMSSNKKELNDEQE